MTARSRDQAILDTALVSAKTAHLEIITPMPSAAQVKTTIESEGLTFVEVVSYATTGGVSFWEQQEMAGFLF
jgi:hypothetical protein